MMQLPSKWKDYTFGDIVKFSGGAQPPRTTFKFESQKGYIRLIQTRDYKSNKYITYIPEELARKKCEKDDIMIGRYGPPIFQILRGLEGAYNVALIKAIPDEQQLNKEYLFYYISQYNVWAFVENLSQRSGGQTGVDLEKLRGYPFPLPPLEEQEKIVQILKTVDDKIEVIEQQIIETQELKKGLMQRLLTKGIGHTEFKDSPLGMIPESWETTTINSIGQVITGSTPKTSINEYYTEDEAGTLWASPSDLTDVKYINTTKRKLTLLGFEQTRKLPPKSILVTCIGSTIGKIGMTNSWMSTNQQINSIVCSNLNDSEFYYYVIEKNATFIKSLAGTQAVPLLNKTDFSSILVVKPTLKEQRQIAEILTIVDEKLKVLSEKKSHYQELKQGLMQKLLTGKIRVKV